MLTEPHSRRRLLRTALVLATALAAPAGPFAATDPRHDVLAEVEAYLEALRSFEARFAQINPDGGVVSGTIYVRRPGQMRVDYDPPSQVLLIATDWRLVFYDGSIQQVNTIPLSQTPLGFLLAERVRLEGEVEVTGIRETSDLVEVTVVRSDARDQGSVTLQFSRRPFELRSWIVVDPQGLETRVVLEELRTDVALDAELFHWREPKIFGFPGN